MLPVEDHADRPSKRQNMNGTDISDGLGERGVSWPAARGTLAGLIDCDDRPLEARDVGIECYVDPKVPPVFGIVKHRFLDFLVNEVTKDGSIVRLNSISRPVVDERSDPKPETLRIADNKVWPTDADSLLDGVLSPDKIRELKAFHAKGPPPTNGTRIRHRNDPVPDDHRVQSDAIEQKESRKLLHQTIRQAFGGVFLSEARDVDGKQVVDIMWSEGNDERDRRSFPRPASHMKYIHFHLQKRNRETNDSLAAVASALNMHVRDLGTSGTKDKRAVTVQRVSLRRGNHTVSDVWQAIKRGGSRGHAGYRGRGRGGQQKARGPGPCFDLTVGDLSYQADGLELGDLGGNRFRLVLRDVKIDDDQTLHRAVATLRDRGFVNYYGMQRFGNSCIGTHVVGLAILQGNFDLAANLLMRPRRDEYPEAAEARRIWNETRDAAAALKILPRNCIAERCLLMHYSKNGHTSHNTAISSIPKNLRMMYVHAYQSRLWNIIASERLRLSGSTQAAVGDLVPVRGDEEVEEPLPEAVNPEVDLEEADDTVNKESDAAVKDDIEKLIAEFRQSSKLPTVKILTEADVDKYSIFDVVLPLAGFLVTYPGGPVGARYRELMLADGLDPTNLFRKQKEYSMGGAYRKMLQRPKDLSYSIVRYQDPDFQLALSDEDVILGRTLPEPPNDGRYTALKLDFTLKSATYATMALREILKSETASRAQKALTEEMQARHAASVAVQTVEE